MSPVFQLAKLLGLLSLCILAACKPTSEDMLLAIKGGVVEQVRDLLDRGMPLTAADKDGRTPLHLAAQYDKEILVQLFLDRGASIDTVDKDGRTALHLAAQDDNEGVVKLLLDRGGKIESADRYGKTPLHLAAEWDAVEAARLLLAHGAKVNAVDKEGMTPLHAAAKEKQEGVARVLLEHGALVNAVDKEEMTPLHRAADVTRRMFEARKGQETVALVLLDRGARIEARTTKGATPLFIAAEKGNVEVARLLVRRGAQVNAVTRNHLTPLHTAVKRGHDEVVRLLLKHGAAITTADSAGRTPLHVAAGDGRETLVRLLLDAGAPTAAEDGEGRSPMHEPAVRGYEGIVRLLMDRGARISNPDKKGWTPVHMAAFHGHEGMLRLLLDHGGLVSATDVQGLTPLHGAAFYGYAGVARVLLDRGASRSVKDSAGWMPGDYARAMGRSAVVQILDVGQAAQPVAAGNNPVKSLPLQLIKVDGSSTLSPVSEAVADKFQAATGSAVRVTVGISGTGAGFQKFCRGETDVHDASRPILAVEMELCRANGVTYFELPVAYDALSVVVSASNTWAEAMTVQELKTIWEPAAQKTITSWNQVRRDWPASPLKLFGPGTESGTFDYFTEAIVGEAKAGRKDYAASEDDDTLVDGIAESRFSLGYIPFSYLEPNHIRLKAVAIDAGKGPVLPSLESVVAGQYQPLSRPLFIYVSQQSADRPAVRQFVEFYLAHAARLVGEVRSVPFAVGVYDTILQKFRQGNPGTVFAGSPAVDVRVEELLTRTAKL